MTSKALLDAKSAAALAGVHHVTFRGWVRKGLVKPFATTPSGRKRFRREDVLKVTA